MGKIKRKLIKWITRINFILFILLILTITLVIFAYHFCDKHEETIASESAIVPITIESESEITPIWFFPDKKFPLAPITVYNLSLFPNDDGDNSDRVVNQLLYTPPNYNKTMLIENYKTISIADGPSIFYTALGRLKYGSAIFKICPVSTCTIVPFNQTADLEVYKLKQPSGSKSREDQIRMVFINESPLRNPKQVGPYDWTSTYRLDSDVTWPYFKWLYFDDRVRQMKQIENYAKGKTKKVAWFVSNCHSMNNRMGVAKELGKYIQVDIYGGCGTLKCGNTNKCNEMLKLDYKFYLAFENSNCHDYVTEKLFKNALGNNVIPIVMGASPSDVQKVAPEHSFIHVDEFDSIEALVSYLNILDKDDQLFNSYFMWKNTGALVDNEQADHSFYWCRVCAMLHVPDKEKRKPSLFNKTFLDWWQGPGQCNIDGWRNDDGKYKVNRF